MNPVSGRSSLNLCLVSSEAVPFAKTGGLADVVGALAVEFAKLGHDVCLIIPGYRHFDAGGHVRTEFARVSVPTESGTVTTLVEQVSFPQAPVGSSGRLRVFAVRHDPFFDRAELYQEGGRDYPDNLERFALFCRAVLEFLLDLGETEGWICDILHVHDWQAALCPVYLRTLYDKIPRLARTRTVLTLHNLGYQGLFPAPGFRKTGLPAHNFTPQYQEFFGSVNLLKGGILFADVLTTVSPTYSREIQTREYGFGLEGVLASRKDVLHGIVNGIDADTWNPATDLFLPRHYSATDLSGKTSCKRELQRELGLARSAGPLLAVIARLTSQKGIDLILEVLPELMESDFQIAVLGTGDAPLEKKLREFADQTPTRIAFRNAFDERLAHRIEGGADMFLMPSRYEPCGLSQLYSLRYGAVPIVRKTGGLADTVTTYTPISAREGRATGFAFSDSSAESLLTSVLLAQAVFANKPVWLRLVKTGMLQDLSWSRSARKYLDLFGVALTLPRQQGK